MKYICMMVMLLFASIAIAADDVLPPPTVSESTVVQEKTLPDALVEESDSNLNRDLVPETIENMEVRSYKREDGSKIKEYSMGGHVYMIRVQPIKDLPAYYLYDNDGDGVFERRLPGGYKRISPPMWVIKKF